jgi:sugar O-acyltransferase (sialic acid O-acetyltransferase NeuD family)
MKNYYIFGTNALALLLYHYIMTEGGNIDGFVLNKKYIADKSGEELPQDLYAIEDVIENHGTENVGVFVPVGYTHMNETRRSVFLWLKEHKVEILSYIHPSATIATNATIGEGCVILEHVIIQPFSKLGDGNILWNGTNISHHSFIGNYNWFAPSVTLSGRVKVYDKCFFGSGSVCKNDIEIHNKVLVGAGAYVYKSLPDSSVFVPQRGTILEKTSDEVVLL